MSGSQPFGWSPIRKGRTAPAPTPNSSAAAASRKLVYTPGACWKAGACPQGKPAALRATVTHAPTGPQSTGSIPGSGRRKNARRELNDRAHGRYRPSPSLLPEGTVISGASQHLVVVHTVVLPRW